MRCAKCSTSEHRRSVQPVDVKRALRPRLLLKGAVIYATQPSFQVEADEALICCALPAQDMHASIEALQLAI